MTTEAESLIQFKVTYKEIGKWINGKFPKCFEKTFDDIPLYMEGYIASPGETHRNFCEDDGREYRIITLRHKETGEEIDINYTYSPNFPNDLIDFPKTNVLIRVDNIEESSFYEAPKPPVVEEKVLTPEQLELQPLEAEYEKLKIEGKVRVVGGKEKLKLVGDGIKDMKALTTSNAVTLIKLRKEALKVCIANGLEIYSFWQWYRSQKGVFKF